MPKEQTQLDELDIKLITDFPLIVDVFVTTMSRIQEIVMRQFKEIDRIVSDFIESKKNYSVLARTKTNGLHKPFINTYDKKYSVEKLEPFYRVESQLDVVNNRGQKVEDKFEIWLGFEYNSEDEDGPIFFYYITKWDAMNKGTNFPLSFYEKLKEKNVGVKLKIEHPENNFRNEYVKVSFKGLSSGSIEKGFSFFLEKVLKLYLQQTKW